MECHLQWDKPVTRLLLVAIEGDSACLLIYFQKAVVLLHRDQCIITVDHYSTVLYFKKISCTDKYAQLKVFHSIVLSTNIRKKTHFM